MDDLNVLGTKLQVCGLDPITGWKRNGCCETDLTDQGIHTVCALVTEPFLAFSKQQGNDLSTPRPEFGFQGLKPGDSWCLCASRWLEAYQHGFACPVNLDATHEETLAMIPLDILKKFQVNV